MILNEMSDGVHQVRFAQTDAAVEEQRVIRHARLLGDSKGGGMRKAVGRADDERVKRRFRVEHVDALHRGRIFLFLTLLPLDALLDAHQLNGHFTSGRLADRFGNHRQIARPNGLFIKIADDLQREFIVKHIDRLERLFDPGRIGNIGKLFTDERFCFFP